MTFPAITAKQAAPKKLLTIREASDLLGVPVNTLRSWRLQGRFVPTVKIEGLLRYQLSDLEEYIDGHTEVPTVSRALDDIGGRL